MGASALRATEAYPPVPAKTLKVALDIRQRHGSLDPACQPANPGVFDRLLDDIAADTEVTAFATDHRIDPIALLVRSDRLAQLILDGTAGDLVRFDQKGSIVVDRALLLHAASVPVIDPDAPLALPVQHVGPCLEQPAAAG